METLVMPWSAEEDSNFKKLVAGCMGLALLFSIVIPFVRLPELSRQVQEALPAHFAEIILDAPEPAPAPAPPVVEPEPEPEPVVREVEPEPIEQVVTAPVRQTVKQAREKAKTAGILAFRDELAALRDAVDMDALKETGAVHRATGEAAKIDRSMITAKHGAKMAGINVEALSRETGGIALASRETTVVEAPVEDQAQQTGAVMTVDDLRSRSIDEIRRVFDANKGAIYAIYNRALRSNPGLLGKVVLELVIEPDGTVSECSIVTAELDDDTLLTKIVARVQLFNFGEKDVSVTRISYPVHFLPG